MDALLEMRENRSMKAVGGAKDGRVETAHWVKAVSEACSGREKLVSTSRDDRDSRNLCLER